MMTPDEFVTESYRAWIDQVANWAADRTDLLQPWCETCAGSDFADSIDGLRNLPHSVVHGLLSGLESGFVRARDRLMNRRRNELIREWRTATDSEQMVEELLAGRGSFVLDLWRDLLARRESQERDLEHWEVSMRERMHDALRTAAAEQTGLVHELIPRAVEVAINDEIEATSIRSLTECDGVDPRDVAKMRAEAEKFRGVSQYRSQQVSRHRTRAFTNRISMAGEQLPKQVLHIRFPRQFPRGPLSVCQFSRKPRLFSFDSRLSCRYWLTVAADTASTPKGLNSRSTDSALEQPRTGRGQPIMRETWIIGIWESDHGKTWGVCNGPPSALRCQLDRIASY